LMDTIEGAKELTQEIKGEKAAAQKANLADPTLAAEMKQSAKGLDKLTKTSQAEKPEEVKKATEKEDATKAGLAKEGDEAAAKGKQEHLQMAEQDVREIAADPNGDPGQINEKLLANYKGDEEGAVEALDTITKGYGERVGELEGEVESLEAEISGLSKELEAAPAGQDTSELQTNLDAKKDALDQTQDKLDEAKTMFGNAKAAQRRLPQDMTAQAPHASTPTQVRRTSKETANIFGSQEEFGKFMGKLLDSTTFKETSNLMKSTFGSQVDQRAAANLCIKKAGAEVKKPGADIAYLRTSVNSIKNLQVLLSTMNQFKGAQNRAVKESFTQGITNPAKQAGAGGQGKASGMEAQKPRVNLEKAASKESGSGPAAAA